MSFTEKLADITKSQLGSSLLSASRRTNMVLLSAADLTGTATRFTITDGPIKILSMGFLVTTAIPAGANTLKVRFTPTGGSATDLCGATDTASASAQQLFVVDGTKATGLVKTTDVGILAAGQVEHMPIILSSGIITTVFSAGAPATGAAIFFIEWEPMNTAATVV